MAAVWEDREVLICCHRSQMEIRRGENVVDVFENVQSDKGNSGNLIITGLRVMWKMPSPEIANVSIGLSRISSIMPLSNSSKLLGQSVGVQIAARGQTNTPYIISFVKSCTSSDCNVMYRTLQNVMKAYDSSRQYRNLVLRGAVVTENDELNVLPKEHVYNTIDGFWNVAGDHGNLGILHITNIRIVWFSKSNKLYNGSIPYFRMDSVTSRHTRYGFAMVIKLVWPYDDLTFGFQVMPEEKLKAVLDEILKMRSAALQNPIYGVFTEALASKELNEENTQAPVVVEEDVEVGDIPNLNFLSLSSLESCERKPARPMYCRELGLAIETPPEGLSLEQLWKVL